MLIIPKIYFKIVLVVLVVFMIGRMFSEDWIELGEAARRLGVHQSTLRRWADKGKIPSFRTLTGRRRFSSEAIRKIQEDMQQTARVESSEHFESKALSLSRRRSNEFQQAWSAWTDQLSEEQQLMFRYTGQRLLDLIVQHLEHSKSSSVYLREGKEISLDYGRICSKTGLSLAQTAEVFLYFRRVVLETLQSVMEPGGLNDRLDKHAFLRAVDFCDSLLVATMEGYASASFEAKPIK
jgi:excisionase family DNA binding protein